MVGPIVTRVARKAVILTLFGVIVVALAAWQVRRLAQPHEYELKTATVTKFDAAQRSGEIEFIHPKNGQAMTVTAKDIPPDCLVLINGVQATLADVRVGDTVAVRGLIYADQSVKPQRIRVTRPETTTQSAPATAPATPKP
jgi:hypothetical protein